jgi:hypothetical protein
MTAEKKRPTFQETRKLHTISRNQIGRITGIHVDALWALEETGRGTEETWKQVIDALNQLAKTDYTRDDFSGITCTSWPVIQVE